MQVNTSRFGLIDVSDDDAITFSEGLLGFGHLRKFIMLDDPTDEIFAWLQSCENGQLAFPILEPELFVEQYSVKMTKSDLEALNLESTDGSRFFTIVTIPEDATKMTANLKAPLVINVKEKIGRQCVLQDNKLNICEPIFTKLQQRLVQQPQATIKTKAAEWGVAVRLPDNSDLGLENLK
ncbi:MAG: flagellar assembly protein FliW [Bdellovibrionaceae bacterium]|jgi:flagellar assembly factor FliW|nr:flagellar assembly protein FliW [Pseudobdellovibrionaceae bacterium]